MALVANTERSRSRREVRDRERHLNGAQEPAPMMLRDFLQSFMLDEKIDLPVLPGEGGVIPGVPPASYERYRDAWIITVRELVARGTSEATAAEMNGGEGGGNLPDGLEQTVEGAIVAAQLNESRPEE